MIHTNSNLIVFLLFIITLMPNYTKSRRCILETEIITDHVTSHYQLVNCSVRSWCCEEGCCSVPWYTWPFAVVFVVVLVCCVACFQACYEAYCNNNRRIETSSREEEIEMSPPPHYDIAIYFPQPGASDRIPSYEEVISGKSFEMLDF